MEDELKRLVSKDEKILFEGKPSKKCYIFEGIFNPMMPFALIWALIDFTVIGVSVFASGDRSALMFIIPFMLIHMMPVWIYLGGALFTFRRYKNSYYIVTEKGVYVSNGIINKTFNQKPFAELSHVDLHRGFFDQLFGVGDIILTSSHASSSGLAAIKIESVENYIEIYSTVKKLQEDIYTDIMYPNDKRPKENHGYNTEYKG